ncbi:MAG: hypothetical protein TE42_07145 [Candidatus Synechococcus spongiarum SP3]|uniref:AB hydrolase-1 domain-containing protein n=1 Tax=Candidatus Synechococcus spongiarum SP3 TaxID=1604020 RepID=A0A0G2J4J4_9SYNE|nr:MAG: hypothetical protein TE42_07145 [Candidatus Synechococcus spongiarum SP3]
MSSWIGQYLVKQRNFLVNKVMPMALGDSSVLTPEIMAHYRNAPALPEMRRANAAFPGHIIGASHWLGSIWDEPTAFSGKPTLILWGLKNTAFRRKELERWKHELSNVQVHEFQNCGHFPEEEVPDPLVPLLQSFMGRTR